MRGIQIASEKNVIMFVCLDNILKDYLMIVKLK